MKDCPAEEGYIVRKRPKWPDLSIACFKNSMKMMVYRAQSQPTISFIYPANYQPDVPPPHFPPHHIAPRLERTFTSPQHLVPVLVPT